MKVLFDDTCHYISFEDDIYPETKCNGYNQFKGCLSILLTTNQAYKFTVSDTEREFEISDKKIKKMFEYMEDNIWNKKN